MAVLTESGRIAVASILASQPVHLAWGAGSVLWDVTPTQPSVNDTGLVAELGRMHATAIQYALPSDTGDVELPEGRYAISTNPTKYLLLTFASSFGTGNGESVRELGVYFGATLKAGIEATEYLTPDQLETTGAMLVVERVAVFKRESNTRQKFTYLVEL